MREILFRGQSVDDSEWIEGFVFNDGLMDSSRLFIGDFVIVEAKGKTHDKWHVVGHDFEEVIPETVGQYTGLIDKNGKRIFEGDIGKYKQTDGAKQNGNPIICIGKVIYNAKTASYAVDSKDEAGRKYFDYFPIKDFEIVGNIHDNPELLEEEK